MRRQIESGVGEVGPALPMVVVLPYRVQYAVAGSGFPSSSSSDVVNFKHIRCKDRVYTSRGEANWRPPRVHASVSIRLLLSTLAFPPAKFIPLPALFTFQDDSGAVAIVVFTAAMN